MSFSFSVSCLLDLNHYCFTAALLFSCFCFHGSPFLPDCLLPSWWAHPPLEQDVKFWTFTLKPKALSLPLASLSICASFYELVHMRVSSALNGTRFGLKSPSVSPDRSSWVSSRCLLRFRVYNLTSGQSSLLSDIIWGEFSSYFALSWHVHFVKPFDFRVLSCNSTLTFFPAMIALFLH